MRFVVVILVSMLLLAGRALAEPVTLRFATLVPEGTAWARELKAFSRDVEAQSKGQLRVRWYLGGIAGDESVVPDRIRRGQLDGEAAGVSCAGMAPSLKVLRVVGLFRRRDEAHAVIAHLRPRLETEFRAAGYVPLGVTWFGSDIALSRVPVRSFADLRRLRLWIWNLDTVWTTEMKMLGLNVVPLSVDEAARAYEQGRVDGFLALPNAALAFQWSARARYFSNLTIASMAACTVISRQTFEALPFELQATLRAAAAKLELRFEDINAAQEDALIGGLFERQGTHLVPAEEPFRSEFLLAARNAREHLPENVVPKALLNEVLGWLSDFRGERR
jgi:TRAP-type C4-dicarboxylate transport system substrate-binding protein